MIIKFIIIVRILNYSENLSSFILESRRAMHACDESEFKNSESRILGWRLFNLQITVIWNLTPPLNS